MTKIANLSAILILRDFIRFHQSDVIFLCETLVSSQHIKEIECQIVYPNGKSDDLAIFWKLHAVEDPIWCFIIFYGYLERYDKRNSWDLLRHIASLSFIPWCILGDFNDLLSRDDKIGNYDHPNCLIQGFREAISNCNLHKIPIEGYKYT
ncbi:hypothetical protein HKD37_16G045299 [Glycine soja]